MLNSLVFKITFKSINRNINLDHVRILIYSKAFYNLNCNHRTLNIKRSRKTAINQFEFRKIWWCDCLKREFLNNVCLESIIMAKLFLYLAFTTANVPTRPFPRVYYAP